MSETKYIVSKLTENDVIEPAETNIRDLINHTTSIIDIFNWCDELGVYMTFGYSKPFDEYFINLNIDKWFKTVYISRELLTNSRVPYIHDLILNAVKELKTVIDGDEKGE